jgi:CheY-like chemotaxis protein
MSLLGRLEDLSLTDIVQIVFLSRRTGVLEIVNDEGRHTVVFHQGLVVNASAPDHGDLITYLQNKGAVNAEAARMLRQMEASGIPAGTAAIDMNVLTAADLAAHVRARILGVVGPLLGSREGEFNFLLSEAMKPLDIEYDPAVVFRDGGLAPQKLMPTDGEKLKPLKGLEDSLKAGKALLRGSGISPVEARVSSPAPAPPPQTAPAPPGTTGETPVAPLGDNVVPFPASASSSQFKVAGGLFEVVSPDAAYRNVVLFERNPLVRVAAKRAFGKRGVKIAQFGSLEDVRGAMTDLFRSNSFFVTFLEVTEDDSAVRLMQQVKRRNPRLPVVLVDSEADLRRRHDVLRDGADLYLTKPSPARLQPGLAEEELSLFADELVLFAERSFAQWEELTGTLGADAGKRFYELAQKENVDRSFGLLKQLINEVSNPNDVNQVAATILRLAGEYLERGALFMVTDSEFVGLGGFGKTGGTDEMSARARSIAIPRSDPSILGDVASSGEAHRGKIRKTPANVTLIERLGGLLPTEVVALPILHDKRPVGILYGDNAEHRAPIDTITGLEIFLSQAGYAFGNAVFASQTNGRGREGT